MRYPDFRGSEESIASIQRKYLQYFKDRGTVVDLGCGRGTFLELLSQEGGEAYGVDSDPQKIEICLQRGLKVECSGVFEFLERNDRQFDGIFTSHLIEHLLPQQTTKLLQSCYRLLVAGGVLVVITPNIGNLHVATETFHLDPTHIRPYPLRLLVALLGETGFEVIDSGEDADTATDSRSSALKRFLTRGILSRLLPGSLRRAAFSGEDIFAVGRKI